MSAMVKPGEDPAAVEARMREILNGLIADGPTQDEINRVVTQYASRRIQGLEQVGGFGGKRQMKLRDILGVLRVQVGRLDLDSMKQWAPVLAVADLLERAFADAAR
jgi:hypothetical protein